MYGRGDEYGTVGTKTVSMSISTCDMYHPNPVSDKNALSVHIDKLVPGMSQPVVVTTRMVQRVFSEKQMLRWMSVQFGWARHARSHAHARASPRARVRRFDEEQQLFIYTRYIRSIYILE